MSKSAHLELSRFPVTDRRCRCRGPADDTPTGLLVRVDGQADHLELERRLLSHHGQGQHATRDAAEGQGLGLLTRLERAMLHTCVSQACVCVVLSVYFSSFGNVRRPVSGVGFAPVSRATSSV